MPGGLYVSFIDNFQFWVTHNFWEGNKVADALLKFAVSSSSDFWWTTLPIFVYFIRRISWTYAYKFT